MPDIPMQGHTLNPFDEPIHEGHLIKLIAPNHPPVAVVHGHCYTSQVEPDPTTPGATRFYAMAWPCHVPYLLAMDPPYRYPDPAEGAAPAPDGGHYPAVEAAVAEPAKGKARGD